jgi:hypothetical protein
MGWGTHGIIDLVRTNNQNIRDYGEGNLYKYINKYLAAYNAITNDELGTLAAVVPNRIMGYGGATGVVVVKVGEYGKADASKPSGGGSVGFPLDRNQSTLQWTRDWLEMATVEEAMADVDDRILADTQQLQVDLKNAFFGSSNRTFIDHLTDRLSLSVKALANNDGFSYPPDPYGNAVAGTHNHYLGTGSLVNADVLALINTVAEHYNSGKMYLYINSLSETAVRALAGFIPAPLLGTVPATTATVTTEAMDDGQLNNRYIGKFGNQGAEVWVKPWVPANYMLAFIRRGDVRVLGMRQRGDRNRLRIVWQDREGSYSLRAETAEREVGFGVWDRLGAAVLYTANATYADPTF